MDGYVPRPDLLVREVDGEIVILDRQADVIHTLNPTASFIWEALQLHKSQQDIVQSFIAVFDIDSVTAKSDVDAVLGNLRALRLFQ